MSINTGSDPKTVDSEFRKNNPKLAGLFTTISTQINNLPYVSLENQDQGRENILATLMLIKDIIDGMSPEEAKGAQGVLTNLYTKFERVQHNPYLEPVITNIRNKIRSSLGESSS